MKAHFAVSLPMREASALGALRRWDDVEVCKVADRIWLRACVLEEARWERCRRLPGADRFTVLDDGQLLPVGSLVPRGYMPVGPWQPLFTWLKVELPPGESSAAMPSGVALGLVRSSEEREATWLLTTLAVWSTYAVTAPQIRLARWSFAADRQGRVLVRGTPLPPLPGERFVEREGIAVPVGYTWNPSLPAETVREALALDRGVFLLWTSDGGCRAIAADAWVRATRSAVRLTLAESSL